MNSMNQESGEASYAPPSEAAETEQPASRSMNAGRPPSGAHELIKKMRSQLQKLVIGQTDAIDQVVACLIAGGHILLEGKPGLGKTFLVNSLARMFGGAYGRVQFTPDLMPADVTGFTLFDMKSQTFKVRKGPVFTNLLLADEINRAPAKTQASLLEVMQERQVTIDGDCMKLDPPFMTLATQNPIEQEGTYPLPEAQLDRFLMKVVMDFPDQKSEVEVVKMVTSGAHSQVDIICDPKTVVEIQQEVLQVRAVSEVVDYAVNIARATRSAQGIRLGAGTRGAISLVSVAKAYAVMGGRDYIVPDDVKYAAIPVLRHRIQLAPELAISGQTVDDALATLIASVEAPRQ